MMSQERRDRVDRWLEEIECQATGLTKWEEHFLESIKEQLENTGSVSPRQEEIVERIFNEKT